MERSPNFFFFLNSFRRSSAVFCMRAMFFSSGVLYQNSALSRLSARSPNLLLRVRDPVS